ncbi:hypothetical protein ABPG72_003897 [Tetrahymena utriculariae]
MKNTVLKTQNKYQEYLQQIEIECVKRDNLFKNEVEKYDYTDTISVYQINLSSKEDQLKFCSVLFMPTYIYQNNSYKINIKEQQIDLLNCMYKYALYDNQGVKYAQICLQNISGNQQTLISYELGCSFFDQEESDVNLKTGILGAKYILLVIKSIFKKELHLLNLDLTLIIKQNLKENFYMFEQEYNFTSDMPQEDANIFESCIDYFEDGIIYYECQQVLFRIVICQKFVSSRVFEERINILLRLLPVTQSEYNYYFKNSDQSSLSGYCNNEKDTLILFADELSEEEYYYKLEEFKKYIISYSKFEKDSQNNIYLPMVYIENEYILEYLVQIIDKGGYLSW